MAEKYIPLFFDINEITEDMSYDEFGRLVRAMVFYAKGEEYEECLEGFKEKFAFRFLKGQIDRNTELSSIRAQSGAKGGKQKEANDSKTEQKEANDSKNKQKEANDSKTEQTEANSLTNTETNTETNNYSDTNSNDNSDSKTDTDSFFLAFWSEYPKKVAKVEAEKAWKKIKPNADLFGRIMSGLQKWKDSSQWKRDNGQYIPNPASWLNGHRWEDEVPAGYTQSSAPGKTVIAQQYNQRPYEQESQKIVDDFVREVEEWKRRTGGA